MFSDKNDKFICCIRSGLWNAVKDDRLMPVASEMRNSPILFAVSLILSMMLCEIQKNRKWVFIFPLILYLHNSCLPTCHRMDYFHLVSDGSTCRDLLLSTELSLGYPAEEREECLDKSGEYVQDITRQLTEMTNVAHRNSDSETTTREPAWG